MCNHCHSLVDFAVSGCGKTWSETMEEGFTFQCLGCWKVDCLTAELANRYCEGDGEWREGYCKENKWRTNNRKHDMQEGDRGESDSRGGGRDKGTVCERSRCDRRKDEGKKGSESRCDQTEVNNKDDDRKKRDMKERNKRECGMGKRSATREMQNGGATVKQ